MDKHQDLEITCRLQAVPYSELEEQDLDLVKQALEARKTSHSPYSKFSVGAALRMQDGTVVIGSNQENAAYPSGLCAERVALFAAGAQMPKERMDTIAVCVMDGATDLPFPCGGCLQVMSEYEYQQKEALKVLLIVQSKDLVYRANSVKDLLPFSFNESHLPD